jgi:hypothetical protein
MTTDIQILNNHPVISYVIDNNDFLQLSHIDINEDYRKKWNIHEKDFVFLTKNGKILNNNALYRVGGFRADLKQDYFMLLKHTEAFYPKEIMKHSKNKDPKHLEGLWCILNKFGEEKKVFTSILHSPYITKNSQIYSLDNNYYNIETGEFYCNCSHSMDSTDFLFLNNQFDKDKNRCGIMKINKKDGSWILFK